MKSIDAMQWVCEQVSREIQEDIESVDIETLIRMGALLNGSSKTLSSLLKLVKKTLRSRVSHEEAGVNRIEGAEKTFCEVVVPTPVLRVKRGVSIEEAKEKLGPAFDHFFETQVKLTPNKASFTNDLGTMPEDVKAQLESLVEESNSTPQVHFNSLFQTS